MLPCRADLPVRETVPGLLHRTAPSAGSPPDPSSTCPQRKGPSLAAARHLPALQPEPSPAIDVPRSHDRAPARSARAPRPGGELSPGVGWLLLPPTSSGALLAGCHAHAPGAQATSPAAAG